MSKFSKVIEESKGSALLNGQGDDQNNGDFYLANGAACFLVKGARALIEDGIPANAVARMHLEAALEALSTEIELPDDPAEELVRLSLMYTANNDHQKQ